MNIIPLINIGLVIAELIGGRNPNIIFIPALWDWSTHRLYLEYVGQGNQVQASFVCTSSVMYQLQGRTSFVRENEENEHMCV